MKNLVRVRGLVIIIFLCGILACKNEVRPTLKTSDITEITTSSAVCGGEITDEGSDVVVARGVCWSTATGPTIDDNKTTDGSGTGSFTSTITGLDDATTYCVRAYATNSVGTSYGEEKLFRTVSTGGQIIADHNAVINFDYIPAEYITAVKKMYVYFAGASHSDAYRSGLNSLEAQDATYAVNVESAQPYTDQYLRSNQNPSGYVQEDVWLSWWDYDAGSRPATSTFITDLLQSYHNNGYPLDVIGFGWCWDMVGGYPSSSTDPVTGNRWWGMSIGGIDGDKCWGIDDADDAVSGNRVNLQDYFNITEYFSNYCAINGIKTKVIYTTGPIDGVSVDGEIAYSGQLKHDAIRAWVAQDPSRILFDYADILAYDTDGSQFTDVYDGHPYQFITPTNLTPEASGHISTEGTIKLAKAQWWLLARIAGWDGK